MSHRSRRVCWPAGLLAILGLTLPVWGPRAAYERANVLATRNVIAACERTRVERLVYTSSPSVCFTGKGHRRAGNDLPYPDRYNCTLPPDGNKLPFAVEAGDDAQRAVGGGVLGAHLEDHLVGVESLGVPVVRGDLRGSHDSAPPFCHPEELHPSSVRRGI